MRLPRPLPPEDRNSFPIENEFGPGLRSRGDGQPTAAGERGDLDFGPQGRLDKGKAGLINQIIALPPEKGMGFDLQVYIKITWGRAGAAAIPFTPQPETGAVVHPSGNFDGDLFLFRFYPLALTTGARVGRHHSGAVAFGTGSIKAEETFHPADSAVAAAERAGLGAEPRGQGRGRDTGRRPPGG